MLGKTEGRKKWAAKDEMVGWHHQLTGHKLWQAPGDSKGQGTQRAAVHGVAESWT